MNDTQQPQDEYYVGCVIKNTWKLVKLLGSGSFGDIFLATSINSSGPYEVAIKFEKKSCPKHLLHLETHVLAKMQGKPHFTTLYYYGFFKNSSFIVMEAIGMSLLFGFIYCYLS